MLTNKNSFETKSQPLENRIVRPLWLNDEDWTDIHLRVKNCLANGKWPKHDVWVSAFHEVEYTVECKENVLTIWASRHNGKDRELILNVVNEFELEVVT